jgi:hypothetical protein
MQSSQRHVRVEPIAEQVLDRAAEVGSRLAAAAAKHSPSVAEPTDSDRLLDSIVDEVFGDIAYGNDLIDSLVRECAIKAASRWLQQQASVGGEAAEPSERSGIEEILTDPLAVVDPELAASAEPLQQLMDEFHAELLVELIRVIGGEGMFPGITLLKVLWALYRWAAARLRGTRAKRADSVSSGLSREQEREILERLLDTESADGPSDYGIEPRAAT